MPTLFLTNREIELVKIALGTAMNRAEQDAAEAPTQDDAEAEMGLHREFSGLTDKLEELEPAI